MTIFRPWVSDASRAILAAISVLTIVATPNLAVAQTADDSPTAMVILDGSGSMWGKLGDGQNTKLRVAQSLLAESLAAPNPKLNLGYASFGHRRAGNCSDAEVIVPPGPNTAETILQRISKHNPRGRGPLSLALRQTAQSIDPGVVSSIVLIHDGQDNCRQDPCQIAEEIAASHPKLAVHLISLDLPQDAATAMSCVAKRTGGTARVVSSESEFKSALQSAMTLAMLRPAKPASPLTDRKKQRKVSKSAAQSGPSRVRLVASFKSDSGPRIRGVTWRISSPANPRSALIEKRATELAEKIPAGRYIISAKAGLAEAEQQLTVGEQGETRLRLLFDAGVISFQSASRPQALDDSGDPIFLTLKPQSDTDSKTDAKPLWIGIADTSNQLIVPTGTYDLDVERGTIKKTIGVSVTSGKLTPVDTTMDDGLLVIESTIGTANEPGTIQTAAPSRPDLAQVAYIISTDDPTIPNGRREVARSASPKAKFQLQPGTFYAEARLGQATRERRFAIGAGQIVRHQFRFDVGRVNLTAQMGNQPLANSTPVTFKVYAGESGVAPRTRPVVTTSKQSPSLILPAGRYRVVAEAAGGVSGQSNDINVQSGAVATYSIPLNAGQVSFQSKRETARAALPRYQIRNAAGDVAWLGRPGRDTSTLLPPGRYVVEKRGGRPSAQTIEIRAGAVTVVDLDGAL